MSTATRNFAANVSLPRSCELVRGDLPTSSATRWTSRRKSEVVRAVQGGLVSFAEASERYALTREEFRLWEAAFGNSADKRLLAKPVHRATRGKRTSSIRVH